jgi:YD repeat-containing protein
VAVNGRRNHAIRLPCRSEQRTHQPVTSGGQTVNYTYDSPNRLSTAQATDGTWDNAYCYDGFGNLTAKTVTAGSAPSFSGWNPGYDANGNALTGPVDPSTGYQVQYSYDVENRIIGAYENGGPSTGYGYDPQGKRVLQQTGLSGTLNSIFTIYGITGLVKYFGSPAGHADTLQGQSYWVPGWGILVPGL